MPKQKAHKGLLKRVRVTASGRVKFARAGAGHLLSHKPGSKRRQLRGKRLAKRGDIARLELMLNRPLKPAER